jgi:hypothetical protein
MVFCSSCGNELPSYAARFCPECGTAISKDNSRSSRPKVEQILHPGQGTILEENKMQAIVSDWVTYDFYETKDVDIFVRKLSKDLYKVILDYTDYEEEEEHFVRKSSLDKLFEEYDIDTDDGPSDTEKRLEETGEVVTIQS